MSSRDAAFLACRPRLLGVAYGMLGRTGEAEDIVQDAWLRWQSADRAAVRRPEAFLVRTTTRLALDRLGSARARREQYVGPWLPEPLLCDPATGPEHEVERAEALSFALLTVLERLDPVQRAVFLLRDVFDLDYAEVADAVDRAPASCRQIAKRARDQIGAARRRFPVSTAEQERLLVALRTAIAGGDVAGLTALLAADATLWSDGGGRVVAARRPILGADRVARFLIGLGRKLEEPAQGRFVLVNGDPGFELTAPARARSVMAFELGDGVVANVRLVNNPDKLAHLRATVG